MANRFLQLKRNSVVYSNRDAGKAKIEELFGQIPASGKPNSLDGEPIAVRYYVDNTLAQKDVASNIGVLVAHTVVSNGNRVIVYNDVKNSEELISNLEKVVGVIASDTAITPYLSATTYIKNEKAVSGSLVTLDSQIKNTKDAIGIKEGDTTINQYHSGDTIISGATTINSALTLLNQAIEELGDSINFEEIIGVDRKSSSMSGLTGSCLSALTSPTVQKALNELDKVIIDNEIVTRNAVDALVTASGFDKEPIKYSVDGSKKYISGSTNIKEALEDLNDAMANHKMISNVTAPLQYISSTETLSLPFNPVVHTSGYTTDELCKNIVSGNTDGIFALADLHYNSVTNKLTWFNTNGSREIQLTGFSGIKSASTVDEELIITFETLDGQETTVEIDLTDLIEEYEYQKSNDPQASKTDAEIAALHNVSLYTKRNVEGKSQVYGDIEIFDCGTY